MKYKILKDGYDKNTGISFSNIVTRYGEFSATARLNPEDKEYESNFFGCQLAEARCVIKALKEQLKIINVQIKTLKDLKNKILEIKGINEENFIAAKELKMIVIELKKLYIKRVKVEQEIRNLRTAVAQRPEVRISQIKELLKSKDKRG